MKFLLLLFILITNNVYAGIITPYETYNENGVVTATNLNGNFNNIINEVNGGLDNDNADTDSGFRFYEVLGSLPVAGTEGRVVYITSSDLLYYDTGSTFVPFLTISGTPAQGDVVYFNGTAWTKLSAGTANYALVTNGAGANPAFEQIDLAGAVTGTLPIGNGGTSAALVDPNADRLVFWDDSESKMAFATVSGGTFSTTTFSTDLKRISTTSVTDATNSGDITISANKLYFVQVLLTDPAAAWGTAIRFNSDNGADYGYSRIVDGLGGTTTNTSAEAAANTVDSIEIAPDNALLNEPTYARANCELFINTFRSTTDGFITVQGDCYADDVSRPSKINIWGTYATGATAITTFEFTATDAIDMTIRLYEYGQ